MPYTVHVIDVETDMWEFGDRLSPAAQTLQELYKKEDKSAYESMLALFKDESRQFIVSDEGIVYERTSESLILQKLLDTEQTEAYENTLLTYTQQGHQFSLTDNVVHEQFTQRTTESSDVYALQQLVDANQMEQYDIRVAELKHECKDFILTGGKVYEKLKYTSSTTNHAKRLQKLLHDEAGESYQLALDKLQSQGHQFQVVDGVVFEVQDVFKKAQCSIKFQVKKNVINWYFIAPFDQTKQEFRNRIYETAAIAHQSVRNSCETYYRGTNHFHLKAMHTELAETKYNHNHYRILKGVVTPQEVYQHLMTFSLTTSDKGYQGSEFVSQDKANEIIAYYTLCWVEYAEDIRYALFLKYIVSFAIDPQDDLAVETAFLEGQDFMQNLVTNLATKGRLTPRQVAYVLDEFIQPDDAGSIIPLKILNIFSPEQRLSDLKAILANVGELYRDVYCAHHSDYREEDDVFENFDTIEAFVSDASQMSPHQTPRLRYSQAQDQVFDEIDLKEYAKFSPRLAYKCRSINDHHLGQLTPDKFRKALLLYNMLRAVQLDMQRVEQKNIATFESQTRIHESVLTSDVIREMISKLPLLQADSSEDELGESLLSQLVSWVTNPPEGIDEWISYVSKHGSVGLGAELAHVREVSGDIRLHFPTKKDRPQDLPHIDSIRDLHDLHDVFVPVKPASSTPAPLSSAPSSGLEGKVSLISTVELHKLEQAFNTELLKVLRAIRASETNKDVIHARTSVINVFLKTISMLKANQTKSVFDDINEQIERVLTEQPDYKKPILISEQNRVKYQSGLEQLVMSVNDLFRSHSETLLSNSTFFCANIV